MDKERGAGILFLLAGLYGSIFSIKLPLGTWEEPGPGTFPIAISILLLVFGISNFAVPIWMEKGNKTKEVDWRGIFGQLVTPLKIVGVTLAFILFMEKAGYLLASSLYMFLLFYWVSRCRLWTAVSLAIGIGAGSWYFFGKFLAVQLPHGFLFS